MIYGVQIELSKSQRLLIQSQSGGPRDANGLPTPDAIHRFIRYAVSEKLDEWAAIEDEEQP